MATGQAVDLALLDEALAPLQGLRLCGDHGPVLIPLLEQAQALYGYLPLEVMARIAERLGIPLGKVYSVATFYAELHVEHCGRHVLQVCDGLSCYLGHGAYPLLHHLSARLHVHAGDTTADGRFTLEAVQCLACCAGAPAMRVDDHLYEHLTPDRTNAILARLQHEA
jgi:NADH:ubiquinone oxidoreductase subunit E